MSNPASILDTTAEIAAVTYKHVCSDFWIPNFLCNYNTSKPCG